MPYVLCRIVPHLSEKGSKYYISGASYLFFLSLYLCLFPGSAIAQIVPDGSLGAESSRIVPDTINNLPSDRITGGATRGSNLFHSFGQFNIGEGRGAYFENPRGVSNIFTRVTGGNSSNILGTLGVQGNANLFLINPKGIVFGPNARLDLRGSFIGTTAEGVVFNNGFEFSSSNQQTSPLLTVNIPVGLRFRDNAGTIVNQSTASGKINLPASPVPIPITEQVGLAVDPGQSLALIGGEIQIAGGNLTASGGQIVLGSVASPGVVNLAVTSNPQQGNLSLNYNNIDNFGSIQISEGSLINTSGTGGGRVEIQGGNVTINSARIYALTLGNIDGKGIDIRAQQLRVLNGAQFSTQTIGDGAGGDINLRATDSVEMSGLGIQGYQQLVIKYLASGLIDPLDPQLVLLNTTLGAGAAGNITIDTGRLLMRDGVVFGGITFGAGNGGNLSIRANTFEMQGSGSNNATTKGSTGAVGNITIDVQRLNLRDGSIIGSTSYSDARSGNITIKAAESVELSNTISRTAVASGISTLSIGSTGKAGDITIDTKRLSLSGGSAFTLGSGVSVGGVVFSTNGGPGGNLTVRASESVEIVGISEVLSTGDRVASAFSSGTVSSSRAGDIRIDTPNLTLRDGGFIASNSSGKGNVGDITINADRIEVNGTLGNPRFNSSIDASVGNVTAENPNATANAGSVNLNVGRLIVRDGGKVTVQALGTGRAGNINVVANSIALDNKARIDGRSASGVGANINLQAQDIQLRRGSQITTDAGTSEGGNININSDILVGLPRENSDITANARSAAGGRVNINVPNIFGFTAVDREQVRARLGLTDAQFAALQVSPTSLLPTSDIAAISQTGAPALQGTVTFSSSGVNPAQGLVELPQNLVNPAALIAANPCIEGAANEFNVTGKGGVPPSPSDALSSAETPFPWVEAEGSATDSVADVTDVTDRSSPTSNVRDVTDRRKREEAEKQAREVVPARGWVVNEKGEVSLVGYNPGNAADSRNPRSNSLCPPR
ncbi:filamentous hemagglutinin N-terminal domain-containing protein [Microcoleus sp. bin38.metabat.b11b12b14.051]|uniref:two-partner secretion domain-containing protein n=1 Tax=Microcoleus sp. bin38.metabat.b11b12b14.051 TaxID=2742709 RepID=UPI0025CBE4C5|nr:filamentous hemagglutinin N-terminal domain-containing protein [Microcoleus sp. bin38.metabat.b11b12b14.051]